MAEPRAVCCTPPRSCALAPCCGPSSSPSSLLGLVACGAPAVAPSEPPRCPPAVAPVASASPSAATPVAAPPANLGLYLPKDRAGGFTSCFDPDSATLRAIDKGDRRKETDAFPSAALADDVRDLKAALQKRYAGYPELAQDPAWDVDRYFADWEAGIRAAGRP